MNHCQSQEAKAEHHMRQREETQAELREELHQEIKAEIARDYVAERGDE